MTNLAKFQERELPLIEKWGRSLQITLPQKTLKRALIAYLENFHNLQVYEPTLQEWNYLTYPHERKNHILLLFDLKNLKHFKRLHLDGSIRYFGQKFACLFDGNTIKMPKQEGNLLLRALEELRLDEVDENGLPRPWVEPTLAASMGVERDEKKAIMLSEDEDPSQKEPKNYIIYPDDLTKTSHEEIKKIFDQICQMLHQEPFPLNLFLAKKNYHGFVSGRFFYKKREGYIQPVKMNLIICPNADMAEIIATLIHEFAHIKVPQAGHGPLFKETMFDIAGQLYGHEHFREFRQLAHSNRVAFSDMRLAAAIRLLLQEGKTLQLKMPEEQRLARILLRIRQLRALADRHPGTHEAITATAIANTLIVEYDLGDYHLKIDPTLDELMIDRWLDVGKRKPWKRTLGFVAAKFCNVFALVRKDRGLMHLFGRRKNVEQAVFLFQRWVDSIERRCEYHMEHWTPSEGQHPRTERTSFRDSAVIGLARKIQEIQNEQQIEEQEMAFRTAQEAENFARKEHEKRGLSWGSGRLRNYKHNAQGYVAGYTLNISLHDLGSRSSHHLLK